jgi:hypothetical protein
MITRYTYLDHHEHLEHSCQQDIVKNNEELLKHFDHQDHLDYQEHQEHLDYLNNCDHYVYVSWPPWTP